MSSFFEKRVMKDLLKRVQTAWPGVVAEVVASDYYEDGLALRVWLNDAMFQDLTWYGPRWVAFLGIARASIVDDVPPLKRPVFPLDISGTAPAYKVAPLFIDLLRENWNDAQEMRKWIEEGQFPDGSPLS